MLVEAINVLTSPRLYAFPRERAAEALSDILRLRGLRIPQKRVYLRALQLYRQTSLDFVDALNVAHAQRRGGVVVSFDRDYDKLDAALRKEP